MLFVAKFAKYRILVEAGSQRWVRDRDGHERQVDDGASFWADFQLGGLETHDQELALQEFRRINPQHPMGAEPLMIDGTINQMDAAIEGETSNAHEAYYPWQRLSRFDTEDGRQCPARWQEKAEEVLLASADIGRDFIRLDLLSLVAPWSTYDEMGAEEAAQFALAGGFNLDAVIRYEKATLKRKEFGVALFAAKKLQDAQKAEREALTVNG